MKDESKSLRILALLLISLAAGPEIGLAMEMTALLEILGAAAFFLSFSVGVRMQIEQLAHALRDYLVPPYVRPLNLPTVIVYAASHLAYASAFAMAIGMFFLELASGTLV